MESMNAPEPYTEPTRRDITAEVTETPQSEAPQEPEVMTEEEVIRGKINDAFKKLGISGKEAKGSYMAANCKVKADKPTLTELKALLKIMEMEIEDKNDGLGELE